VLELEVQHLAKTYGSGETAVRAVGDLTFDVQAGEFVCIVGPSGCGKTTLLKCLSGLLAPSGGIARLEGNAITGPPEAMALVFQDYSRSLMPWMSIASNVTLPLRAQGVSKADRNARAQEALEAVGLGDAGKLFPWQLSGGMQQRAAIARALAYKPRLLLMDEPFASVDAQTRSDLEDLVLNVHREFGITVLFVTHDIDESVYLADRVIVLTHRPTHVKSIIDIDLPRPRDQVTTKELPEFARLRGQVVRLIRGEKPNAPSASPEDDALAHGAVS
jgi:NitT/TauT family transport system ATP-binding protein